MERIDLSVHALVDSLFRSGDLDSRVYNLETMKEGSRLHLEVQRSRLDYQSEVDIDLEVPFDGFLFHVHGRADLVYESERELRIEEIKSTVAPLGDFHAENEKWHLAQAVVYAYALAREKGREKADIDLFYLSQVDSASARYSYSYSLDELKALFESYLALYLVDEKRRRARRELLLASLSSLPFPYQFKRKGQERMEEAVSRGISEGKPVFIEAPTGIGKTVSSLYPALKSFPSGTKKVFFLTAKNSGGQVAARLLEHFAKKGAPVRYSILESKERMCLTPGANCNPDECPFAKGYYGKLPALREESLKGDGCLRPEKIREMALDAEACPFELELDLSEDSDVIIADYNYLFDPLVALERYFGENSFGEEGSYVALVDEAHNLVERSRDIYGVNLSEGEVLKAREDLVLSGGRKSRLKALDALLSAFAGLEDRFLEGSTFIDFPLMPPELKAAIENFQNVEKGIASELAKRKKKPRRGKSLPPSFRELSRKLRRAAYLLENVAGLTHFLERGRDSISYRFLLLDPSSYVSSSIAPLRSTAFFSATLSPLSYYTAAILGKEADSLSLDSPFPRENFLLLVAPVSTRYRDRERTYPEAARCINEFVSARRGNCFVFFPSYDYLSRVLPFLDFGTLPVHAQTRKMSSSDREEFLSHFVEGGEGVGLLVLGGPFSEGIDLVNTRLTSVVVVGVGFPQVSHERDLLRESRLDPGEGFLFAYVYPGINKVMQAMGRLIRSEEDTGAILLIDDRYRRNEYSSLFASTYRFPLYVYSPSAIKAAVLSFSRRGEKKV